MILVGIILGPYALNLLDNKLLDISSELRKIALVIILTRAGFSLNIKDLKKVGRPVILMCFVPACFEILSVVLIGTTLFDMRLIDAAIMGSVIAAVSPAVIVPRIIRLMEEGYGTKKSIPQLILAGASVDDVFVIVLFTAFTGLAAGERVSAMSFVQIPIAIIMGVLVGVAVGYFLNFFFGKWHMRDTIKVLIILSVSFLLLELETLLEGIVPVSGLLAIMSLGIVLSQVNSDLAKRMSLKYNKLWLGTEIILFVLVGATVDLKYVVSAGVTAITIVVGALLIRMLGVFVALLKTELTMKERFFCMLAYTPKATVQAAIGGVPLSMGLSCGQEVLTVAVLAILITAPFGAICVDASYKKLLTK